MPYSTRRILKSRTRHNIYNWSLGSKIFKTFLSQPYVISPEFTQSLYRSYFVPRNRHFRTEEIGSIFCIYKDWFSLSNFSLSQVTLFILNIILFISKVVSFLGLMYNINSFLKLYLMIFGNVFRVIYFYLNLF